MNRQAEQHLAKAEKYLGKGEEFYRKAAQEIVAARDADDTLGFREIGARFDRSEKWVRDIVQWHTSAEGVPSPWAGKEHADNRATAHTKRILRDAPLEQVEQIISELPEDRQRAVAAAAGNEYLKARQEYDEKEDSLTPAERKAREASKQAIASAGLKAAASFATLGIAGHLEQATEELRELISEGSLTRETFGAIAEADNAWRTELQVAAAMVGLEEEIGVDQ